ncbi:hypothetical protein LJB42_004655 [Komagataella kurtzmanii]|nr:hypothetical protein LJB42_004655 [Komagataella kurtzmanii]
MSSEDELDDLLDEFQDEMLSREPGSAMAENTQEAASSSDLKDLSEQEIEQKIQENFENMLSEMASVDPKTSSELQNFIKDLEGSATPSSTKDKKDFKSVISETVNKIRDGGDKIDEQIKSEQPDELLSQLLKNLDIGDLGDLLNDEGGDGNDNIGKMLVEMLDQLSSKKILYEPIKELYDKYPAWLEAHKTDEKISKEEFSNYQNQYSIVTLIVERFDKQNYDDNNTEDKEFISTKLEELQELGMPPTELANQDLMKIPGFGDGNGGVGGLDQLDGLQGLQDQDLPEDLSKELDETCKQQ